MIRAIEGDTESRVPIVALTAYAFKEERQRSFEAGCDAHLTKPIPRKDLLAAIDKYGKCTTIVVEVDEEIRALVDGFLANRHADVKRLMNAVEIGDFETIRMIGHSMKDTGRNYGFDGITDIGALLEVAGEETEMMNAQRQIAELIDYLDRVESRSEQRPAEGEVERG
jgi:response regulator RpfG family c-di-GMP phosphodiesterase